MKVLIWVGNPVGHYGREYRRELVRVWVDDDRKVHVEPLAPQFEYFAKVVQDNIDTRLADPRGPVIMRLTGDSWIKEVEGEIVSHGSVTRQELAMPGDDNFLQVLMSDRRLVGNRRGEGIAGYAIRDGASRIVEE